MCCSSAPYFAQAVSLPFVVIILHWLLSLIAFSVMLLLEAVGRSIVLTFLKGNTCIGHMTSFVGCTFRTWIEANIDLLFRTMRAYYYAEYLQVYQFRKSTTVLMFRSTEHLPGWGWSGNLWEFSVLPSVEETQYGACIIFSVFPAGICESLLCSKVLFRNSEALKMSLLF